MKSRSLPIIDEFLIVLVLLHNVPIIGFHTPAILYGIIVVLLYVFTIRDILFTWNVKLGPILCVVSLPILAIFANLVQGSFTIIELYGLMQNLAYPMIGYLIIKYDMPHTTRLLFWTILLTNLITALTTFIGCSIVPNASRILASTERLRESGLEEVVMNLNIGGFSYNYGWALMTIPLIMIIKERVRLKAIWILTIFVFGLAIVAAEYTLCLILYVGSLLLFFVPSNFKGKSFLLVSLLVALAVFLNLIVLSQLIEHIANNYVGEEVGARLNDLASVLSGRSEDVAESSDMMERNKVYTLSLDAFFSNPLGVWDIQKIGGHSYVLDPLGRFGLLGAFLIILTYRYIYVLFLKPFKDSPQFGFILFAFLFTILTEFFNPQPNLLFISFVLPIFLKYKQQSQKARSFFRNKNFFIKEK